MKDTQRERQRLAALHEYQILDTLPEADYDRIVKVASQACDTPIALISLVDSERQWFKASVGLDAEETPRDVSFCTHAVAAEQTLLVEDASADGRFSNNPLVRSDPNIRFYCGVPIRGYSGHCLGTLCVIDQKPREMASTELETLQDLARHVEVLLELRRNSRRVEELMLQRAHLGNMVAHDANNLLTVVVSEAEFVIGSMTLQDARERARQLRDATQSLKRLLSNFTQLNRSEQPEATPNLQTMRLRDWGERFCRRESLRVDRGGKRFESTLDLSDEFVTDPDWLERVLLNLLDNAIRYAPADSTIRMDMRTTAAGPLEVTVEDEGPGVPESDRERIFDLYFRRNAERRFGTGLGLAFCQMAIQALNGRIWVEGREPRGASFRVFIPPPSVAQPNGGDSIQVA